MSHPRTIISFILLALLCWAGPASASDCGPAATLWQLGAERAEAIARRCQLEAPGDVERIQALAQVLAWRSSWDEALAFTELGLTYRPDAPELQALRLRLLAWQGRGGEAEEALRSLPAGVVEDEALLPTRGDLAFWRGDHQAAVEVWDRWLAVHPDDAHARRTRALSLQALGDHGQALAELQDLCVAGDRAACGVLEAGRQRPWLLHLQGGPIADEGRWGWIGRATLETALARDLRAGATFEMQERRFGQEAARDPQVGIHAAHRLTQRFSLEGGGGFSIDPAFSALWNAWLEASGAAGAGFTFHLRYWHLEFRAAGVEVLSPALSWEHGPFRAHLRAWRGWEPDRDPTLAAVARLGWAFHGPFDLEVGAGAGDRVDYLAPRDPGVERHVIALAGLGWQVDSEWKLRGDWVGRWEESGSLTFRRDEFLLGLLRRW